MLKKKIISNDEEDFIQINEDDYLKIDCPIDIGWQI